jgi:hypothetical protein
MSLLINIQDLLTATVVESHRLEYKAGWNPGAIMRTEGRGTCVPTIVSVMAANGSPVFDVNEPVNAYVIVERPIHPAFEGLVEPLDEVLTLHRLTSLQRALNEV